MIEAKRGEALSVRAAQALVIVSMLSGLINLIPTSFMVATVIIDGICWLMLAGALILAITRGGRVEAWMLLATAIVLLSLALTLNGSESLSVELLAVRSSWLYVAPALFIAFAVRTRSGALAIVKTVMYAGLAVMLFGCAQFVLRRRLPDWLLYSRDTKLFGYWGTDITRSTGLVGNSIVYGTLATLVFALWVTASFRPGLSRAARFWTSLAAVLSGAGVLVSFSRVAIAAAIGIVIVAVGAHVLSRGYTYAVPSIAAGVLTASILALWAMGSRAFASFVDSSFIIQGLFGGSNASVAGSTSGHDEYTRLALASFAQHPFIGVGLGSQSQASDNATTSVVITDGFHLSSLVEGGLVLMIPTLLFFIVIGIRLMAARRQTPSVDAWISLASLLFLASQILFAGFFNTGFYGKVPYVVSWIVFGACVAIARSAPVLRARGRGGLGRYSRPLASALETASSSPRGWSAGQYSRIA